MTWTGERIKAARAQRGWSQRDLAKQIGASPRSVGSWERDEATPDPHWIPRLDDVFADINGTSEITNDEELPADVIRAALEQADELDLLAEVARRMSPRHASAALPRADPPERYKWFKRDAPTARSGEDPTPGVGQVDEHDEQSL